MKNGKSRANVRSLGGICLGSPLWQACQARSSIRLNGTFSETPLLWQRQSGKRVVRSVSKISTTKEGLNSLLWVYPRGTKGVYLAPKGRSGGQCLPKLGNPDSSLSGAGSPRGPSEIAPLKSWAEMSSPAAAPMVFPNPSQFPKCRWIGGWHGGGAGCWLIRAAPYPPLCPSAGISSVGSNLGSTKFRIVMRPNPRCTQPGRITMHMPGLTGKVCPSSSICAPGSHCRM